jgi:probable HAF family extracellular repeat protein
MAGYTYNVVLQLTRTVESIVVAQAGDNVAGINDSGEISGSRSGAGLNPITPFLFDGTTVSDINTPPLAFGPVSLSFGLSGGLNNAGEVVGSYLSGSGIQGFVDDNGTLTTLPAPVPSAATPLPGLKDLLDEAQAVTGFDFSGFLNFGVSFTSTNFPTAINDDGAIVGFYLDDSGQHAYVYDNGTYTTFSDPLATGTTTPLSINNAGDIVGYYTDATGQHGFLDHNGTFTTFDDPVASPGTTLANGINNNGEIVGTYKDASGSHGFTYENGSYTTVDAFGTPAGTTLTGVNDSGQLLGAITGVSGAVKLSGSTFTTITAPDGTQVANALGINDNGDIVGSGYLLSAGILTPITGPAGSQSSFVGGINDSGQIVGSYNNDPEHTGVYHGFLYSGGTYTTIDVPGGEGGGTVVTNISDNGQIVGTFGGHSFLDNNGSFTDIDGPNNTTTALDVNNLGQVVGYYIDSNHVAHGFIYNNGAFATLTTLLPPRKAPPLRTAGPMRRA